MGVDQATASQADSACLLFYVGCTATAERVRELGAAVTSSTSFRRRLDQALAAAPAENM